MHLMSIWLLLPKCPAASGEQSKVSTAEMVIYVLDTPGHPLAVLEQQRMVPVVLAVAGSGVRTEVIGLVVDVSSG